MITLGEIHLTLPFVHSKKERRSITNHIIDRLKRSNISVMDSSGEYPHEALILFTFIRADRHSCDTTVDQIEKIILERVPEESFSLEFELI